MRRMLSSKMLPRVPWISKCQHSHAEADDSLPASPALHLSVLALSSLRTQAVQNYYGSSEMAIMAAQLRTGWFSTGYATLLCPCYLANLC